MPLNALVNRAIASADNDVVRHQRPIVMVVPMSEKSAYIRGHIHCHNHPMSDENGREAMFFKCRKTGRSPRELDENHSRVGICIFRGAV